MKPMTRAQQLESDLMDLLWMVYVLLMPGVRDLAGFDRMSDSKLYTLIRRAEGAGRIRVVKVGQTFEQQTRVILTNKGIHQVCAHFSLPLKPQLCAGGSRQTIARLRLYEPLMRLLPRLFRSGAIATPLVFQRDPGDDPREVTIDESTQLVDIDWLESTQENSLHAIGWYRTGAGDLIWVPIVTVGFHHSSARQAERDRDLPLAGRINPTAGQNAVPAFVYGMRPATPPGIVYVVLDRLAGWSIQRQYTPADIVTALPAAIVEASGEIIRRMNPSMPMGRIERPPAYTGRVGLPEGELEELLQAPRTKAMMGIPRRKVFEWVNGIQGCNTRLIANGVGHDHGDVKAIITDYVDAGLMIIYDDCVYLWDAGRVAAATRDRLHPNVVHGRLGHLTSEDPSQRLHDRVHEQAVALVKAEFLHSGIPAYEGWRLEVTYPGAGGTQIRPDLWVLVPLADGTAMWCAVEVERSAAGNAAIERKISPFRIARDFKEEWPVLVVAGKGVRSDKGRRDDLTAAQRFATLGSDLPLLAIPFHQAIQGRMTGSDQGWLHAGETVPITHLRTIANRRDLIVRPGNRAW